MNFKKGDVVNVVGTCSNGIILSVNEDTCEVFFPETTYVKSGHYKLNNLKKTTKVIKIIDKNNEKLNKIQNIIHKRDVAFDGQEFGATYCDLDNIIEEIREVLESEDWKWINAINIAKIVNIAIMDGLIYFAD